MVENLRMSEKREKILIIVGDKYMQLYDIQIAVMQAIKELLKLDREIGLVEDLQKTGLDSKKTMKLVVLVEGMFGFEFTDEDLIDDEILHNVQNVSDFIFKKINE
jgi:acyl carrier protein